MLIDAEGAVVSGEIQTHGGDNPDTVVFENVEESQNIDQTRIFSEFDETLLPAEDPRAPRPVDESPKKVIRMVDPAKWVSGVYSTNPTAVTFSSVLGSAGTSLRNPVRVMLDPGGNQTQTGIPTIPVSPDGLPRFVEIYVNADFTVPQNPGIIIPPNVYAKLFVKGNLSFGNRDVNYKEFDPDRPTELYSSRVPGNFQMFGISESTTARVDSSGNGHIVGVFYGPQYTSGLDGNTEVVGSFVLKNYSISGGGGSGGDSVGAGFHYDEALGVVGPIQAYKVVSYFEDHRRDVE
jgi:hypothetical protein